MTIRRVARAASILVLASCSSTTPDSAWGEPIRVDNRTVAFRVATSRTGADVRLLPVPSRTGAAHADPTDELDAPPRLKRITRCLEGEVQGKAWMTDVRISADGRFVAFVAEMQTGFFGLDRVKRLVVYDVETGEAQSLKPEFGGQQLVPVELHIDISSDGRRVAFLVNEALWADPSQTQLFVCDWGADTLDAIDVHSYGVEPTVGPVGFEFSDDMNRVVIELTGRGQPAQCLVIDRTRGEAHTLLPPEGSPATEASISGDGRYVAFVNDLESDRPGLKPHGLWVYDLRSRAYEQVPVERWADADAAQHLFRVGAPRISHSGRYIAILGSAGPANGPANTALLVDRSTEAVSVISRDQSGMPRNAPTHGVAVAEDGNCAIFVTSASLGGDDHNETFDVFRYDCSSRRVDCISANAAGKTGNAWSFQCDIAEDGRSIVLWSSASNLLPDDRNKVPDIFLWRR